MAAEAPAGAGKSAANAKGEATGKADKVEKTGRVELGGASGADGVAPKELKVTIASSDWSYGVELVELDRVAVKEVSLAVEPFVDEKGRQYPIRWGVGKSLAVQNVAVVANPLAPGARKTIRFQASLPSLGTYTANVTPLWGGAAHQKLLLKVVRERPSLNLALGEPSVFAQDGNTDRADFSVVLRETSGAPLVLEPPTLASLLQVQGSGSNVASVGRNAKLAVLQGDEPVPPKAIKLGADQSTNVELALEDFPGAGKYEAKLRFAAAGTLPLEKTITLLVRQGWWLAALCIGLGVAVSAVLRWWVNKEKPRLERLARVTQAAREIDAALVPGLDAAERELIEHTRTRVARALSDIRARRPGVDDAAVTLLGHRVAAVRALVPVRGSIRVTAGPPRDEYLQKLAAIADDLESTSVTLEKLKEHEETLRKMPSEFRKAAEGQRVREDLRKVANKLAPEALKTLQTKVDALIKEEKFDQARTEIEESVKSTGATLGAPGAAEAAAAGYAPPTLPLEFAEADEVLRRGVPTEIAINVLIGVTAVLLGLKALYVDDLTWGGAGSMLIAFLWGLGLHQFTYGGVGSVLDKVAKGGGT